MQGKNYAEYDLLIGHTFWFVCQSMKFFFEMSDGSLNLNDRRIEIEYIIDEDGKTYHLTTYFENKDLITYKEAFTDFNNIEDIQKNRT
ncbi:hypothetical protein B1B04_24890 [Lysinibacillus sp. KCTC 33748]|uniref:hypothetical protein n=1 Tax=unclassified Lysinibacillus TaxID=2636778 RepID=UPI0009A8C0E4|nr:MULTISPECIES: hypothetical protein [unclassified Lysinibacillus]OXS65747.1 hypothetical protein B1B04_24890 [Lysinibacillus sp. KCTC 33748]SKC19420.1 hypothetical protein SAMN06295926_14312 [Lysinibacillus sp. AC-3]